MNETEKREGETRVPAQQAQQAQPSNALNDHIQSPRMLSEFSENAGKDCLPRSGGSVDGEPQNTGSVASGAFDEARFTAGVVKLYEALLKEPIPDEMIRLVDQLGKQERE